jgi:hypothetical protein
MGRPVNRRSLIELAALVLAVLVVTTLLRRGGALAERASRADSTAAAHATVALEVEHRRQVADSSLEVERQARTLERQQAARQLVGTRLVVDSLLRRVAMTINDSSMTIHDSTDPFLVIAHAVTAERAACDLTIALCEQARAAAELRAAAADSSARQLQMALVDVEARWQVALRKAHRGPIRRGAEAAALAGCVVAGAGVGAQDIGLAMLIGGGVCLLELIF